ncbi:MAG TPA: hypothetical protein VJU84_17420 [Pyrinomonadaceae bacterium]|nr:hypothetical protein [Pyrinomonadaceae bacterium]
MVGKTLTDSQQLSPDVQLTIERYGEFIAAGSWDKVELLTWPPDVFALTASILLKSGAYCHAVSGWEGRRSLDKWIKQIGTLGKKWQDDVEQPPASVRRWHKTIVARKETLIFDAAKDADLCDALLQLCAAADEACKGVGFGLYGPPNEFQFNASLLMAYSGWEAGVSTLCKRVHHSIVRVLPKLHTPQSGITIRSLSHHLALCPAGDVKGKWTERMRPQNASEHCLNLLLIPWPLKVSPADFKKVDPKKSELPNMPKEFGFFEYDPSETKGIDPLRELKGWLDQACRAVGKIHGVVFPELALTTPQYSKISSFLVKKGIFFIAGVRERAKNRESAGQNYFRFDIPFLKDHTVSHKQNKHHRWRLDKRQIVQYGIGSCLDVQPADGPNESKWWEHIALGNRELYFVVLDDWLTVCALICEDLARQDPVAELVRAVGPNLVIALLMDGPQLTSRWPARYATVLADDPGSSVLTFTSLGMCEMSRPPSIQNSSRVVALWKDAKTGEAVPIELPRNAQGIILTLSREFENEWSADGRDDNCSTGYPTLSGINFVGSAYL